MPMLKVRQAYRYPRGQRIDEPTIDGLPNFYWVTKSPGLPPARLERGINQLPAVARVRPAILIGSSPHKAGSESTPWSDFFDIDRGHVRYFGDSKEGSRRLAHAVQGNAALLEQFRLHHSGDRAERSTAAPILLFRRVPADGRRKGQVEFDGLALVERAELVTQVNPSSGRTFANYQFDLLVLDLSTEGDSLDWDWVDARRRPGVSAQQTLKSAPKSWRRWVDEGSAAIDGIRRRAIGLPLVQSAAQLPSPGSEEGAILERVYLHYKRGSSGRSEHGFEAVAELVARSVLARSGQYRLGWITRKSGDFGIDFVGRLDVGEGFATARLVVLGQAKCEKTTVATSAQDLARTVARLRRGWLGIYVTTSFYSTQTQVEAREDAYPLVLVNGLQVAQAVLALALEQGYPNVEDWLDKVDEGYPERLRLRAPDEILAED